jgi:hypothetical protein
MASIDKHPHTGNWRVRFRIGARHYHLSLGTTEEGQAAYRKIQIEETLSL